MKDCEGTTIKAGDTIMFSYGIPPVRVEAPIVLRNKKLIALTPAHNPKEIELKELQGMYDFYKLEG